MRMHKNILQWRAEMDIQVLKNNQQRRWEFPNLKPMVLDKPKRTNQSERGFILEITSCVVDDVAIKPPP